MDDKLKEVLDMKNEAEVAYEFRIWFGAVFFYFLNRRKIPFNDLMIQKFRIRNLLVGYFLILFFVALFFYIAILMV